MKAKKLQSQLRKESLNNPFTFQAVLYQRAADRIDQLEQEVESMTEEYRTMLQAIFSRFKQGRMT